MRLPWSAKNFRELVGIHSSDLGSSLIPAHFHSPAMVREEVQVQLERPFSVRRDDFHHLIEIAGLTVGSQRHYLPFVAVVQESQVLRYRRVEKPKRMGKQNGVDLFESAAPAPSQHCAAKIAKAVHRQESRLLER